MDVLRDMKNWALLFSVSLGVDAVMNDVPCWMSPSYLASQWIQSNDYSLWKSLYCLRAHITSFLHRCSPFFPNFSYLSLMYRIAARLNKVVLWALVLYILWPSNWYLLLVHTAWLLVLRNSSRDEWTALSYVRNVTKGQQRDEECEHTLSVIHASERQKQRMEF